MEALCRWNYLIECRMVLKIPIELLKFKGNDDRKRNSSWSQYYNEMDASIFLLNRKEDEKTFKTNKRFIESWWNRLCCKNDIFTVWYYNSYLCVPFFRWWEWLTFRIVMFFTRFVKEPDFLQQNHRKLTSSYCKFRENKWHYTIYMNTLIKIII